MEPVSTPATAIIRKHGHAERRARYHQLLSESHAYIYI